MALVKYQNDLLSSFFQYTRRVLFSYSEIIINWVYEINTQPFNFLISFFVHFVDCTFWSIPLENTKLLNSDVHGK